MDALVLGGSGLIGERIAVSLLNAGFSVTYTYFGNTLEIPGAKGLRLDISNPNNFKDFLGTQKPELIVNTVALPSVDKCDEDKGLAFRVNAEPQKMLAEFSNKTGAGIVYISTSNVFGYSERPLNEEDIPGPISTYGRTKLRGEEYTIQTGRHIILRTDQVYGWTRNAQKKTFVERTLEKLERNEVVEVCGDWLNCPTYADDIAKSLVGLIAERKWGIFHAVGPTYLDRYAWAKRIADEFGLDQSLVRLIDSSSLNLPAKRSNCALSNRKIIAESGVHFLSVDEGLKKMRATRNIRHP